MNITKKLFTGSALQTINLLIDIGIGFLMMPFLISSLNETWYGLWLTVGSIIGFFSLLTVGLGSAVQRYLSIEISEKKATEYNKTLNSALFVFFIAAVLAILVSFVLSSIPSFLNADIEQELKESFRYLIVIMGFNIAISFASSPFRGVLNSNYSFTAVSLAELLTILSKTILTISFIWLDYGVIGLALATIIGNFLGKTALILSAIYIVKRLDFGLNYVKKDKLRILFKYSGKTFLVWLGDILRFSIDNLVITTFVGLTSVTIYNLPVRLYHYASQFIITSLAVLQPLFSQLAGTNDFNETRRKFEIAYGISFALSALLASGLLVFGYEFISLWVSPYPKVEVLIYFFAIMIAFETSQNPCLLILYSHNKHQYYAYQNIGEGVFNAVISIIAVQYWGIIGVAVGSLAPQIITKLYLQPKITCNLIKYSLGKYYLQMAKSYSFIILASALGHLFKTNIDSWFLLVVNVAIFSAIFIPCYWFIALNNNTKTFFYTKLKRK